MLIQHTLYRQYLLQIISDAVLKNNNNKALKPIKSHCGSAIINYNKNKKLSSSNLCGILPHAHTKAAYQMNPIVLIMSSLTFPNPSTTLLFTCCFFIVVLFLTCRPVEGGSFEFVTIKAYCHSALTHIKGKARTHWNLRLPRQSSHTEYMLLRLMHNINNGCFLFNSLRTAYYSIIAK